MGDDKLIVAVELERFRMMLDYLEDMCTLGQMTWLTASNIAVTFIEDDINHNTPLDMLLVDWLNKIYERWH